MSASYKLYQTYSAWMKNQPTHYAAFLVAYTPTGFLLVEDSNKHSACHAIGGKAELAGDWRPSKASEVVALARDTLDREMSEELGFVFRPDTIFAEVYTTVTRYGDELWSETYFMYQATEFELYSILKGACSERPTFKAAVRGVDELLRLPLTCAGRQALMMAATRCGLNIQTEQHMPSGMSELSLSAYLGGDVRDYDQQLSAEDKRLFDEIVADANVLQYKHRFCDLPHPVQDSLRAMVQTDLDTALAAGEVVAAMRSHSRFNPFK